MRKFKKRFRPFLKNLAFFLPFYFGVGYFLEAPIENYSKFIYDQLFIAVFMAIVFSILERPLFKFLEDKIKRDKS